MTRAAPDARRDPAARAGAVSGRARTLVLLAAASSPAKATDLLVFAALAAASRWRCCRSCARRSSSVPVGPAAVDEGVARCTRERERKGERGRERESEGEGERVTEREGEREGGREGEKQTQGQSHKHRHE